MSELTNKERIIYEKLEKMMFQLPAFVAKYMEDNYDIELDSEDENTLMSAVFAIGLSSMGYFAQDKFFISDEDADDNLAREYTDYLNDLIDRINNDDDIAIVTKTRYGRDE